MTSVSAHGEYFGVMRDDQIASSPAPAERQRLADEWDRMMAARDADIRQRALRDAENAAVEALNTWWLTETLPEDDTSSVMDVRNAIRSLRSDLAVSDPQRRKGE